MSGESLAFNSLLLSDAVLCADCEMISNSRNVCRCCGSSAVMSLSQVLGGSLRNVRRAVLLEWVDPLPFKPVAAYTDAAENDTAAA